MLDCCNLELLRLVHKIGGFGCVRASGRDYAPMKNIDVSVIMRPDCRKEGVAWTWTCHKENGYAPILSWAPGHLGS